MPTSGEIRVVIKDSKDYFKSLNEGPVQFKQNQNAKNQYIASKMKLLIVSKQQLPWQNLLNNNRNCNKLESEITWDK